MLAVVLPFGALQLPTSAFSVRRGRDATCAHAPSHPRVGGAEAAGAGAAGGGVGKRREFQPVEPWCPRGRVLPIDCGWCQGQSLWRLAAGFGISRVRVEGSVLVCEWGTVVSNLES